jgi:hypothetical protein
VKYWKLVWSFIGPAYRRYGPTTAVHAVLLSRPKPTCAPRQPHAPVSAHRRSPRGSTTCSCRSLTGHWPICSPTCAVLALSLQDIVEKQKLLPRLSAPCAPLLTLLRALLLGAKPCHRLEPLPCPAPKQLSADVVDHVGLIFGSSCGTPRSYPELQSYPTSNIPSDATPHQHQPPPVTLRARRCRHQLRHRDTELANPTVGFITQRTSLPPSIPVRPNRITMNNLW